jgi:hypothetical protein
MNQIASLKTISAAILAVALSALIGLSAAAAHESDYDYDYQNCKPAGSHPWKFGIMSNTQWKSTDTENNPNTVAAGIIKQLNRQFIFDGVEFVIQVGDLTDNGSSAAMDTRPAAAQALYDAGIGFYPLRGNHESSQAAALQFQSLYPQSRGTGTAVFGARNFSSPFSTLNGLSYAFDYNNARFILLDQFTRTDNTNYLNNTNNNIIDQQNWISGVLASKSAREHAFVFGHKGLITENHTDTLFGANPASSPDAQNAFIGSLTLAGVRYLFGGHDHMHNRAIITSPDRTATVQDITTSSNSYKFYIPQNPSNDANYNNPTRETELAQELFTVGYYIVTVDGPRVFVDFYSSPNGCNGDCDLVSTPSLSFTKRETFGYSMNGKEFRISQGQTYTGVEDKFSGTTARVLNGVNSSTGTDYIGRQLSQTVDTGWTPQTCETTSDILSLWGMATTLGSSKTGTYTLSMTYDGKAVKHADLESGKFGLVTTTRSGTWVNAVDMNYGGTRKFVYGPWSSEYKLGTYGVDPGSRTVWAVINYNADFAAAPFQHPEHDLYGNGEKEMEKY